MALSKRLVERAQKMAYKHYPCPEESIAANWTIIGNRNACELGYLIALQDVREELLNMLNTSIDNNHFFEQLDEYIDELNNQ